MDFSLTPLNASLLTVGEEFRLHILNRVFYQELLACTLPVIPLTNKHPPVTGCVMESHPSGALLFEAGLSKLWCG